MNPPGWYPDPAGTPNSFRWWDGQNWTSATTATPATTPPPQDAVPQVGPESGGGDAEPGRKVGTPVMIGIGAAVVALVILAGVFLVPRFLGGDEVTDPPPSVDPSGSAGPQTPDPSQSPGGDPGEPAELNCAGGNQNSTSDSAPVYSAGGLQYEAVPDWGFRFDRDIWPWLDDQAVFGTIDVGPAEEDWVAGIALGGVQTANGFNDPASAAANLVECLTTYGGFNDGSWKVTEESSEDVTVADLSGHRSTYLLEGGEDKAFAGYEVVSLVLDTGREGSLGTWMSFAPVNDATTNDLVATAEESIVGN